MTNGLNVAVVGATGAVGEEMISVLAERSFPVRELRPMSSARSAGQTISFHGEQNRSCRSHSGRFRWNRYCPIFSEQRCESRARS